MEFYLPSEIARLVLGYLEEEKFMKTYSTFMEECPYLSEYSVLLRMGRQYPLQVGGLNLKEILDEHGARKLEMKTKYLKTPEEPQQRRSHVQRLPVLSSPDLNRSGCQTSANDSGHVQSMEEGFAEPRIDEQFETRTNESESKHLSLFTLTAIREASFSQRTPKKSNNSKRKREKDTAIHSSCSLTTSLVSPTPSTSQTSPAAAIGCHGDESRLACCSSTPQNTNSNVRTSHQSTDLESSDIDTDAVIDDRLVIDRSSDMDESFRSCQDIFSSIKKTSQKSQVRDSSSITHSAHPGATSTMVKRNPNLTNLLNKPVTDQAVPSTISASDLQLLQANSIPHRDEQPAITPSSRANPYVEKHFATPRTPDDGDLPDYTHTTGDDDVHASQSDDSSNVQQGETPAIPKIDLCKDIALKTPVKQVLNDAESGNFRSPRRKSHAPKRRSFPPLGQGTSNVKPSTSQIDGSDSGDSSSHPPIVMSEDSVDLSHLLEKLITKPSLAEKLAKNINKVKNAADDPSTVTDTQTPDVTTGQSQDEPNSTDTGNVMQSGQEESRDDHIVNSDSAPTPSSTPADVAQQEADSRRNSTHQNTSATSMLEEILDMQEAQMSTEAIEGIIQMTRTDPEFDALFNMFGADKNEFIQKEYGALIAQSSGQSLGEGSASAVLGQLDPASINMSSLTQSSVCDTSTSYTITCTAENFTRLLQSTIHDVTSSANVSTSYVTTDVNGEHQGALASFSSDASGGNQMALPSMASDADDAQQGAPAASQLVEASNPGDDMVFSPQSQPFTPQSVHSQPFTPHSEIPLTPCTPVPYCHTPPVSNDNAPVSYDSPQVASSDIPQLVSLSADQQTLAMIAANQSSVVTEADMAATVSQQSVQQATQMVKLCHTAVIDGQEREVFELIPVVHSTGEGYSDTGSVLLPVNQDALNNQVTSSESNPKTKRRRQPSRSRKKLQLDAAGGGGSKQATTTPKRLPQPKQPRSNAKKSACKTPSAKVKEAKHEPGKAKTRWAKDKEHYNSLQPQEFLVPVVAMPPVPIPVLSTPGNGIPEVGTPATLTENQSELAHTAPVVDQGQLAMTPGTNKVQLAPPTPVAMQIQLAPFSINSTLSPQTFQVVKDIDLGAVVTIQDDQSYIGLQQSSPLLDVVEGQQPDPALSESQGEAATADLHTIDLADLGDMSVSKNVSEKGKQATSTGRKGKSRNTTKSRKPSRNSSQRNTSKTGSEKSANSPVQDVDISKHSAASSVVHNIEGMGIEELTNTLTVPIKDCLTSKQGTPSKKTTKSTKTLSSPKRKSAPKGKTPKKSKSPLKKNLECASLPSDKAENKLHQVDKSVRANKRKKNVTNDVSSNENQDKRGKDAVVGKQDYLPDLSDDEAEDDLPMNSSAGSKEKLPKDLVNKKNVPKKVSRKSVSPKTSKSNENQVVKCPMKPLVISETAKKNINDLFAATQSPSKRTLVMKARTPVKNPSDKIKRVLSPSPSKRQKKKADLKVKIQFPKKKNQKEVEPKKPTRSSSRLKKVNAKQSDSEAKANSPEFPEQKNVESSLDLESLPSPAKKGMKSKSSENKDSLSGVRKKLRIKQPTNNKKPKTPAKAEKAVEERLMDASMEADPNDSILEAQIAASVLTELHDPSASRIERTELYCPNIHAGTPHKRSFDGESPSETFYTPQKESASIDMPSDSMLSNSSRTSSVSKPDLRPYNSLNTKTESEVAETLISLAKAPVITPRKEKEMCTPQKNPSQVGFRSPERSPMLQRLVQECLREGPKQAGAVPFKRRSSPSNHDNTRHEKVITSQHNVVSSHCESETEPVTVQQNANTSVPGDTESLQRALVEPAESSGDIPEMHSNNNIQNEPGSVQTFAVTCGQKSPVEKQVFAQELTSSFRVCNNSQSGETCQGLKETEVCQNSGRTKTVETSELNNNSKNIKSKTRNRKSRKANENNTDNIGKCFVSKSKCEKNPEQKEKIVSFSKLQTNHHSDVSATESVAENIGNLSDCPRKAAGAKNELLKGMADTVCDRGSITCSCDMSGSGSTASCSTGALKNVTSLPVSAQVCKQVKGGAALAPVKSGDSCTDKHSINGRPQGGNGAESSQCADRDTNQEEHSGGAGDGLDTTRHDQVKAILKMPTRDTVKTNLWPKACDAGASPCRTDDAISGVNHGSMMSQPSVSSPDGSTGLSEFLNCARCVPLKDIVAKAKLTNKQFKIRTGRNNQGKGSHCPSGNKHSDDVSSCTATNSHTSMPVTSQNGSQLSTANTNSLTSGGGSENQTTIKYLCDHRQTESEDKQTSKTSGIRTSIKKQNSKCVSDQGVMADTKKCRTKSSDSETACNHEDLVPENKTSSGNLPDPKSKENHVGKEMSSGGQQKTAVLGESSRVVNNKRKRTDNTSSQPSKKKKQRSLSDMDVDQFLSTLHR